MLKELLNSKLIFKDLPEAFYVIYQPIVILAFFGLGNVKSIFNYPILSIQLLCPFVLFFNDLCYLIIYVSM